MGAAAKAEPAERFEPMPNYFEPPPEPRVAVNMRLPVGLKAHLDAIVKLWQVMADAQGVDSTNVNLTYVCERLLRVGVDGVWAQTGGKAGLTGMPRTDEDWDKLIAAIYREHGKTPPPPRKR